MINRSTELKKRTKPDFGRERIEILYEDEFIAVIFKPSGMLSVPYPGSNAKTAIESLEKIMRQKGTWSQKHRPFAVHRLDRDTSGVMMFALTERAQKKIMDTWQTMVTERLYIAVAENPHSNKKSLPNSGTIDAPLAYNSHNVGFVPKQDDKPKENAFTKRTAIKNQYATKHTKNATTYERNLILKNGKPAFKTISAITHYKVIARGKTHTAFELNLETGRKNQIRAHLAWCGYPLAGDENYRAKTNPFGRLALHAKTLTFIHPFTNEQMNFSYPEPSSWLEFVQ